MIWMATPSGVTMYHPLHNQLEVVNGKSNHHGTGCSVIEDLQHLVWVVYDHQITCVTPSAGRHGYELSCISYSSLDGLQTRQFNERSVLITRKGEIVVGGQDGINIIQPKRISSKKSNPKVIFSGLILLGHPLSVGEKFNGRVVLSEILDKSRKVELQSNESDFTILLASNEVTLPSRSRFLYRLNKGAEEWLMTPEDKPSITFTNLSYGHYILEIKVVNADGTISDNVSQLEIVVEPPFYLSIWAILCYVVLLILGFPISFFIVMVIVLTLGFMGDEESNISLAITFVHINKFFMFITSGKSITSAYKLFCMKHSPNTFALGK